MERQIATTLKLNGTSKSDTATIDQLREDMMEEVGIPGNIQKAIVDNHEPNAEGIYPDWADKYFVFKHREFKIVKHLSATAMR